MTIHGSNPRAFKAGDQRSFALAMATLRDEIAPEKRIRVGTAVQVIASDADLVADDFIDANLFDGDKVEFLPGTHVIATDLVVTKDITIECDDDTAIIDIGTQDVTFSGEIYGSVNMDGTGSLTVSSRANSFVIDDTGSITLNFTGLGIIIHNGSVLVSGVGGRLYDLPMFELELQNTVSLERGEGSLMFARTTVKNYIDRYGVLQQAAIDIPAFEKEGCLIEGTGENLLTYSEQFDNVDWTKNLISITANDAVAPDGTTTADLFTEADSTTAEHNVEHSFTSGGIGVTETLSVFAKKHASGTGYLVMRFGGEDYVHFDLDNAVVYKNVSGYDVEVRQLAGDWLRLSMTVTRTVANGTAYIGSSDGVTASYVATSTTQFHAWGAQVEEQLFPTSYIQVVISTDTRGADSFTIQRAQNFPDSLDPKTVIMDIHVIGTDGFGVGVFDSGNLELRLSNAAANDGKLTAYMAVGSTCFLDSDISGDMMFGVTYDNPGLRLFHNGLMVSEDTDAQTADAEDANIVIGGGINFFYLKNLRVYNRALSISEMRM